MNPSTPSPENRAAAAEAFNQGVRAMTSGAVEEAVTQWSRALELDNGLVPAAHNLIVYFEEAEDWERAAHVYDFLLASNPYDTDALVRQAGLLKRLGRLPEARDNYIRAITIHPYFRFWYEELGEILTELGDQNADRWRERGYRLDSDAAELAFEDGVRQLRNANTGVAIACFEAVLEDYPANLDARERLSRAYLAAGDAERAIQVHDEGLSLTESALPLVHFRRSLLYARLGRLDRALADAERAVELEPHFGRARLLAEQLRDVGAGEPARPNGTSRSRPTSRSSPTSQRLTGANRPAGGPGLSSPTSSRVTGAPRSRTGTNRAVDDELPWDRRFIQLLAPAIAGRAPGGGPSRVALIVEPNAAYGYAVDHILTTLQRPELALVSPQGSRVLVIETEADLGRGRHGLTQIGWLGTAQGPRIETRGWKPPSSAFPLASAVAALRQAAGREGFNITFIVSGGSVRNEAISPVDQLQNIPSPHLVWIRPTAPLGELAARFSEAAVNWAEIALPT